MKTKITAMLTCPIVLVVNEAPRVPRTEDEGGTGTSISGSEQPYERHVASATTAAH